MNPMLFKFVTLTCLVGAISCAHHLPRTVRQVQQGQLTAANSPAAPGDAAAKVAAQQAKLHYVEIGPSLKGDYKFGYDTGSGPAGQSFREETRLDDGTVKGAYGYVDANGKQRIVKYTAGKEGFVVENDQEAPGQASGAQAAPAARAEPEVRRPQPVSLPQQQQREQASAQPQFDEQQPQAFQVNRATAQQLQQQQQQQQQPTAEDRARAEREHAEGLRQHHLAQQAALAQQHKLAQQLHMQQQQILAAQPRQAPQSQQQQQQQQFSPQQQFPPQANLAAHHQQQAQFAPQHQTVDPQTGSFFSSSNDATGLQGLFAQQQQHLRQQPQPQQPGQFAQASPAFQQAAAQFGGPQAQGAQPQDFSQFRAARQAAAQFQQQPQHAHPHHAHQQQQQVGPQSVLAALHQQQQHDAQMLAQLRAQHLARLQEQARQAPQQQQATRVAQPDQQQQQLQFQAQAQAQAQQAAAFAQGQRAAQASFAPQQVAASQQQPSAAVQPQPESFGPPVIDIRTLNYSIGMQTRV